MTRKTPWTSAPSPGNWLSPADVVAGLEMPVLAAFLEDRGEWLREIAVDTVLRFGAGQALSDTLAETGFDIDDLGVDEVAEGLVRMAAAEAVAVEMVGFFGFVLAFVIGFIGIFADMYRPQQSSGSLEVLTLLSVLDFSAVYFVGSWATDGQTIGKTILGPRVVASDGSQLSAAKAFLRYIGYIVNAIVLSIGFLWAAFDQRRQGWHDKTAGTLVIYVDHHFTAADKRNACASIWMAVQ